MLFVLSTKHKVLSNSRAFQGLLIYIYLQDVPHFDYLIISNTFLCNFLSAFALAGNTCIHVSWIIFVLSYPVFCFFGEILSFGFFPVNSEYDAYWYA